MQDAQEYTKDGVTYKVDGHNVILDYSAHEKEIAELLEKEFGGEIVMNPKVDRPEGIRVPDYMFRGERLDLKDIYGNGKNTIYGAVAKKMEQANNFVIDISNSEMSAAEAERQIANVFKSKHTRFVDTVILVRDKKIIKVFKRK